MHDDKWSSIFPGLTSHGDTVPLAYHMPLLGLHHRTVPDRKAKLTFPVETPSGILGRLNINIAKIGFGQYTRANTHTLAKCALGSWMTTSGQKHGFGILYWHIFFVKSTFISPVVLSSPFCGSSSAADWQLWLSEALNSQHVFPLLYSSFTKWVKQTASQIRSKRSMSV